MWNLWSNSEIDCTVGNWNLWWAKVDVQNDNGDANAEKLMLLGDHDGQAFCGRSNVNTNAEKWMLLGDHDDQMQMSLDDQMPKSKYHLMT